MKSPLFKLKTCYLFGLLFLTNMVLANQIESIFFEDSTRLNYVEDILYKTSISQASVDLSIGYVNIKAFDSLTPGSSVYIPLPGFNQTSTLLIKKIDHNIKGVITISGAIEGINNSTFVISKEKERVLGSIRFKGFTYIIEPTSADDNRHIINKLDRFKLLQNENDVIAYDSSDQPFNNKTRSQVQNFVPLLKDSISINKPEGVVKVLFLYANDVEGNTLAANVVTEFNNIAEISLVSLTNRIESAGEAQLINTNFIDSNLPPYIGTRSRVDVLNSMKSKSKELTDIDIRMKSVGADIAVLFIKADQDPALALGRVGGVAAGIDNSLFPYAVVTDDYALGDLTAVHEIGHLLGGAHALPLEVGGIDKYQRGHGVEDVNGLWQTIMGGYVNTCVFDEIASSVNQPCERLGYFSNPNITLPPITGGQPIGHKKYANMTSVLNMTMPSIAQWGTFEEINYTSPVMGFSFDPIKNGHGIHISQSGSVFYLYFFSYDQYGEPEWFIGDSTFTNNQLSGVLQKVNFNSVTNNTTVTTVGSFSLDYGITQVNNNNNCDGVNRTLQPGVFNWTINNQSDTWCMSPIFKTEETNRPSIPYVNSGLWYEPPLGGWGMSIQVDERIHNILPRYQSYVISYYYDSNGVGRWASGLSDFNGSSTVFHITEMYHVYGYPRNEFGTFGVVSIGDLFLDLGVNKKADINLTYPIAPGGTLNKINATIDQLTQ